MQRRRYSYRHRLPTRNKLQAATALNSYKKVKGHVGSPASLTRQLARSAGLLCSAGRRNSTSKQKDGEGTIVTAVTAWVLSPEQQLRLEKASCASLWFVWVCSSEESILPSSCKFLLKKAAFQTSPGAVSFAYRLHKMSVFPPFPHSSLEILPCWRVSWLLYSLWRHSSVSVYVKLPAILFKLWNQT